MEKIFSYRDLDVWKRSRELVKMIYVLTDQFPQSQRFSLCQQMQRAVVSVPSNIAEGQVKRATRDYMRHLNIALGSLAELDTQILLAMDLEFINTKQAENVLQECGIIGRMLNKLVSSLRRNLENAETPKPEAQSLEPAL